MFLRYLWFLRLRIVTYSDFFAIHALKYNASRRAIAFPPLQGGWCNANMGVSRGPRHQNSSHNGGATISIAQNKPLNRQNSAVNRQKCQKKMSRSIAVSKNNPIFVLRRLWTNIQKQFYSTRFYCLFRAVLSAITTPAHRPLARVVAWGSEAKLLNFTLLCYYRFALSQQCSELSSLRLQSSLRPSQPHPTRYGAHLWEAALVHNFRRSAGPSSVFWSK